MASVRQEEECFKRELFKVENSIAKIKNLMESLDSMYVQGNTQKVKEKEREREREMKEGVKRGKRGRERERESDRC